jgi:hypothetical protein
MATKAPQRKKRVVAKKGGATARANAGASGKRKVVAKTGGATARTNGGAKVDWRARVEPARVTEPRERRRVLKRATTRVKTNARVDTVHVDS